jgi:hypothetical protein
MYLGEKLGGQMSGTDSPSPVLFLCNFWHPKIHRKHRKHTSEKYMSVCLTSKSVQQKKRWTAQKNIKTYIYIFSPHRGEPQHGYCSSSRLSYLATATATATAMATVTATVTVTATATAAVAAATTAGRRHW